MDAYVTWIIANWATALVYYILAGLVTATVTSFYLSLRGEGTPHSLLVIAVVLPPVWWAIVVAHIVRTALLWIISKYRGPKRQPWYRY